MRVLKNHIGTVTHLVFVPENSQEEDDLSRLEQKLPAVAPGEIEKLPKNVVHCLPRALQHLSEAESHTLDIYVLHEHTRLA